jgi:hypothetical protein
MRTGFTKGGQTCQSIPYLELVVPEIVKRQTHSFVVIDNLRYDQWKVFLKAVANYYKLEKKFLTTPFYSHTICETRFSRHRLKWKNSFRNIGKMILKKEVKPV